MDPVTKELKAKIEDYSRFIITLIIVSFYFYLGSIISIYIEPKEGGSMLMLLSGASISVAMFFVVLWKKWKKDYQEIQS